MEALFDLLQGSTGTGILEGISRDSGESTERSASVVQMALPILIGAMNRNTNSTSGAEGLMGALSGKHDGSLLDNLGSFFEGGVSDADRGDGQGILGHILGNSQDGVVQAVSGKTGVSTDSVMRILQVLAPIVMAYLGKEKNSRGIDSGSGISDLIGGLMGGSSSNQQSMVEALLDGDNDGSVVDDRAGMFLGGSKSKGGGLGDMLGGFLGR